MPECECCDPSHTEENLRGLEGIVTNHEKGESYLYIEHFNNEKYRIPANYCPACGKKL